MPLVLLHALMISRHTVISPTWRGRHEHSKPSTAIWQLVEYKFHLNVCVLSFVFTEGLYKHFISEAGALRLKIVIQI
jgi:hypothetical protein